MAARQIALLVCLYWLVVRCATSSEYDEFDFKEKPPTIEVVLLVHPYNKAQILPYSLGGIESQIYPKKRINISIRTETILSSDDQRAKDANERTLAILKQWVTENRQHYHQIELEVFPILNVDHDDEYWTRPRFEVIIAAKENALIRARGGWADYALFFDADVVLTNKNTFRQLLHNEQGDQTRSPVFAPMLYSLGTYSNFWAGITESGYYKRTDDYIPILERQKRGLLTVPMVHSCFFVDLRKEVADQLSFVPKDAPYDDIISFAFSASRLSIPLQVSNEDVWGYIMPPTDGSKVNVTQDLIDLELEALVEGPSFPIARSLENYVLKVPKDKLGMDHNYVINLIRRPERLQRMQASLERIGLDAQIWPATDGKDLREEGLRNLGVKVIDGYVDPYHGRPMTFGEIGCFLSHFFIWQDIVNRNFSKAIVLEDDVRFERNMKQRFLNALSEINLDEVDFIYLGRKKQGADNEVRITVNLVKPTYSYWTIGYFITAKGAQKLLKSKPKEHLLPVDEYLPIMYDEHPNDTLKSYFPKRNLVALTFHPTLVTPTHFIGDDLYISDTEASSKLEASHPKHTEL